MFVIKRGDLFVADATPALENYTDNPELMRKFATQEEAEVDVWCDEEVIPLMRGLIEVVFALGQTVAERHEETGTATGMADAAWARYQEILKGLDTPR